MVEGTADGTLAFCSKKRGHKPAKIAKSGNRFATQTC